MPNTLGLDDDLEPVEVVESLEAAFDIRFTDAEKIACRTVGDVYAIVRSRFWSSEANGTGCVSAMAFYRLRRAFSRLVVEQTLRPNIPLDEITNLTTKTLFKELANGANLRMPRHAGAMSNWGVLLAFLGLLAFFAALIIPVLRAWWFVPVLTFAAGFILVRLDPGRLPSDCRTLGDLAKKVAGLNFGKLTAAGAAPRDKDLWNALIEVLSEHSSLPKSEIRPETLLLKKQLRAA